MNDKWISSKKSTNNVNEFQNYDEEKLSKIVSSVIHEYDVIQDPPNTKSQAQGSIKSEMIQKSKTDNVGKMLQEDNANTTDKGCDGALIYPRINCKERIVSISLTDFIILLDTDYFI